MAWKPDYITVPELKSELHMDVLDTADDAQLARWVTSASRAVDDWTNRQFGVVAAAETRTYVGRWDRHQAAYVVDVDDFGTLTDLAVSVRGQSVTAWSWTTAGYRPLPLNALQHGMVYEQLRVTSSTGDGLNVPAWHASSCSEREYEVTAIFGWPAVPVAVKQATMLQAMRLAERRNSPFGVAGSPENGGELMLQAKLDVDAQTTAKAYRREWWSA